MADNDLTAESITARLRKAEERKAAALSQYEAASAEITWLRDGLRLFDSGGDATATGDTETRATELFPGADFFVEHEVKPTLRQAIVVVMQERPGSWTVTELSQALDQRGWLPENGAKRVSDMAGDMVRLGQVLRPRRGVYVLSPGIAAALESASGSKK